MMGEDKFSYVTSRFGVLACEDNASGWLNFATDPLNNVRQVLDGSVGTSYEAQKVQGYMLYGEVFDVTQVTPNPEGDIFTFTGELMTENMVHLRARNYIPMLGIFPSLDPLEGGLNDIMMLNRYGYVGGNVPNFVDPSGFAPCDPDTLVAYPGFQQACSSINYPAASSGVLKEPELTILV